MDDQPSGPLAVPGREREGAHRDRPAPGAPLPGSLPPPGTSRRRSTLWLVLMLLAVAGVAAWVIIHAQHQAAPTGRFQSGGPMPVGTATVAKGDMPVTLNGLGTVTPLAVVTVQTQISGQLTEVAFNEGQIVQKGQFLAQIDPRPYQVALEQTQAQLAKDQATLANDRANLARYDKLVAQNSIAVQTRDTQAAQVRQDIATVAADKAAIDAQNLNLTYCHIISPVSGRVGLRQVDAGNYVTPTNLANGIVVITQIQPISTIFTLPEDSLRQVLQRTHTGARLTAIAFDRTGTTRLDSGTLETIDNQIDTTTGTVKLRAIFPNPDQILFPNQFVNVQLLVNTLRDADIVPLAAVQRGEPGTFVYVVKPDNTVTAQAITLGPDDSRNVAVTKGLQPGERVVVDGADRLKDGAKVKLVAAPAAGAAAGASSSTPPAGQKKAQGQKRGGQRGGQ
jgi:multidrug efflux system membrane fusion protein